MSFELFEEKLRGLFPPTLRTAVFSPLDDDGQVIMTAKFQFQVQRAAIA